MVFVFDPLQGRFVIRGVYLAGFVYSTDVEKPYVPEYNAFENQPDPPALKLCRGCSERGEIAGETVYGITTESHPSLVHPCDGNGCQCPICDIANAMKDINARQDLIDRWSL